MIIMCNVLDKRSTWYTVNRLTLNISKTKYMLFGKHMLSRYVVIHIQNVNIERVRAVQFLGVYVDDLLNWNYHITKSKLSNGVGMKYKCSHMLNRSSMHIILFTVDIKVNLRYQMLFDKSNKCINRCFVTIQSDYCSVDNFHNGIFL